jgi:hypothetical protein
MFLLHPCFSALQALAILETLLTDEELKDSELRASGSSPISFLNLAAQFALEVIHMYQFTRLLSLFFFFGGPGV